MSSHSRDKETYIRQYYAKAKKWLNQCIICQTVGYKPEMPHDVYPGVLAQNIRKMFSPLHVNELNLCEECAKHMHSK